ncbi:MAG TPA: cytochrome c biogenesis protein CcsA, partial [Saprospiraceae bacterium]|nr:cytochrome c biogenesis protein CcsA [Saprospiraceae bacterium]
GDDDALETPDAIRIRYQGDSLLVKSPSPLTRMVMATQQKDSLPGGVYHPLMLRSLFTTGGLSFVVSEFNPKARVEIQSKERKMSGSSTAALQLKMTVNGESREFHISGSPGMEGTPRKLNIGNLPLAVSYGSKIVALPFQIKLRDFIMERYPGTNSASSYASEVTLIDPRESATRDIRIYMNHILDHDGYRFFQSSFDKDELGTYLSVNHDAPGTWVSYIGYFLLTLGMILSLFSKSSRFQILKENIQKLRAANKVTTIALVLLAGQGMIQAQSPDPSKLPVVDARHAELFGELVVQDLNGRMKPVQTLALEVLRKLSRKEELYGMNAEQVFLSMAAYPELWDKMPIIKIGKHEKIEQLFNPQDSRIAYIDLFNADGSYKLKDEIRAALNAKPIDRGVFEKEIIKLDEKVNIANMIFSGNLLRLFPVVDHPNNHWEAPNESMGHGMDQEADHFPDRFYDAYLHQIREGIHNKDWQLANSLITELSQYQKKVGSTVYPSDGKLKAEIMLNQLDVFGRLGKLYGLLGLWFVALLFTSVFAPGKSLHRPYIISFYILLACFAFQTLGLGLRWYVSGRAPWSNGYESMIYIAWTTVLAGLLFSRKSLGGLAATTMLSATVLMVAGLSWMDPEITPLVPVLKSYWLTIHVSLEAGSYGFLVLGALIGVLNLILMILTTEQNKVRMDRIIREMSYTSEMTLIGGLIMLSTGTYLGGIWANESWGRYWGWDAKETWALVSILVYSFILHMRLIPGLQSLYAF